MSEYPPIFQGRTAILGGTFNPVHAGHLRMAVEVGEALKLDCVELTPCNVPPHKSGKGLLPFDLRVEFLREALLHMDVPEGDPACTPRPLRLAVSRLEAELPPPSYTANLLRVWAESRKATPLFILGDEDFACINSWREGLLLPAVADFIVVGRSGTGSQRFEETVRRLWPDRVPHNGTPQDNPVPAMAGAVAGTMSGAPSDARSGTVQNILHVSLSPERSCVFMPLPRLDISASRVRELWLAGRNTRYLLPDAVLRLMRVHAKELQKAWDVK